MKTTHRLTLLALAASLLTGCSSLNARLSGLQGLTVGTITESRKDPLGGGSFTAQGVHTDSVSGITTINSASVQESYPMWAWGIAVTGIELDPKTAAPVKATPVPAVK